jgi:hypothetical protein
MRYTESDENPPEFVSVKEAAKTLGVSPWVALQLCEAGDLESHSKRMVSVASLRRYEATLPAVKR